MHRLFSVFSPTTRWSRPVVGAALTAGLVLSAGAKQPLQNAEAPAEQVEQSATSSRNTSCRATLSSGKEGGRYELTPERRALLDELLASLLDDFEHWFQRGEELLQACPEEVMPLQERRRCLLYTSPSPRDMRRSRMPSSA